MVVLAAAAMILTTGKVVLAVAAMVLTVNVSYGHVIHDSHHQGAPLDWPVIIGVPEIHLPIIYNQRLIGPPITNA